MGINMDLVRIRRLSGRTHLVLGAVVDISTAGLFYERLNKALSYKKPLVLNAGRVERIDTAAMQVLAAFCRTVRDRHLPLEWKTPSAGLQGAAEMLGLQAMLGLRQ